MSEFSSSSPDGRSNAGDDIDRADPSSFPNPATGDDQPLPLPADSSAELYRQANARLQSAAAGPAGRLAAPSAPTATEAPVSFARQMVQLALIPALIVGVVLGVWAIVVSLSGRQMSVPALLDRIATIPAGPADSVLERPAHQERYRAAMTLLGIVDSGDFTPEDRTELLQKLPATALAYKDVEQELGAFLMGALGILSDPSTLPTFEQFLTSGDSDSQYAGVFGLCRWRGQPAELRPLVPALVYCLNSQRLDTRTLAAITLGSSADPGDMATRNALAQLTQNAVGENRSAAWNAGVALAALGDARGTAILLSLLDRQWLAGQPAEPDPNIPVTSLSQATLDEVAQDKVIATAINVAVVWDVTGDTPKHRVRIRDEAVWAAIRQLALQDPSPDIREVAGKAIKVYEDETSGAQSEGGG